MLLFAVGSVQTRDEVLIVLKHVDQQMPKIFFRELIDRWRRLLLMMMMVYSWLDWLRCDENYERKFNVLKKSSLDLPGAWVGCIVWKSAGVIRRPPVRMAGFTYDDPYSLIILPASEQ